MAAGGNAGRWMLAVSGGFAVGYAMFGTIDGGLGCAAITGVGAGIVWATYSAADTGKAAGGNAGRWFMLAVSGGFAVGRATFGTIDGGLGCAAIAGIGAGIVWATYSAADTGKRVAEANSQLGEAIQSWAEARALALIAEYPRFDDQQIATIMHDDLMNARQKDPRYFRWATADTVGRIRRTAIRHAMSLASREED